ncbi:MAG: helix-turn-helix transcriptional regulator [Sutterellaceae bacterium]|nr:helix-turn-helix transcriptional regulator [Sutterellaceae bacterium]
MKAAKTFEATLAEQMHDTEFREGFLQTHQELAALVEIRKMRTDAGLTQADVAAKMGTSQPAVARLERKLAQGDLPSSSSLKRYAAALGKRVKIVFV